MTQPGLPPDPVLPLLVMAAHLHHAFTTFLEAGFTESQALYLVNGMNVWLLDNAEGGDSAA